MVRPAAGRIGECQWTGLDPSACFGSFFVPTRDRWLYMPRSRERKSFTSSIMNHNAGSGLVSPVSDICLIMDWHTGRKAAPVAAGPGGPGGDPGAHSWPQSRPGETELEAKLKKT